MNENFFITENENKYYLLGWILSDGHVSPDNHFWSIQLHMKDRGMLVKILSLINSEKNIYGPYKDRSAVQIQIVSKKHCEFLTNDWGLDNHKSQTLKWKDCPDEFLPHLVRGYFDGDGSIYTKQSSNPNVRTVGINFVGTHDFINGLRITINKANNFPENTGYMADYETYAGLIYNGHDIALKILDWMYLDTTDLIRLDRKFEKYLEYKKYIEEVYKSDSNNKSVKFANNTTVIPDYVMAQKIRFDYEYLGYSMLALSEKYNVNYSTLAPIVKNITHIKSDNRNGHSTVYFTAFGESKHILDWVNDERCNVDLSTLRDRIVNQNLDPELALTKLPDSTSGVLKHTFDIDGDAKTITEILKDKGISRSAFIHRVFKLGMDAKEASEKLPGEIPHKNVADGKLSNNQKNNLSDIKKARDMYQQEDKTIKEISLILGINEASLHDAIMGRTFKDSNYNYDIKKSDTIQITYNGITQSIRAWSKELDIPYTTIDRRYRDFQSGKIQYLADVFYKEGKRLNLGKSKSDRDKKALEIAHLVREDYQNGLIGKANYEKHNIPKSRYIDLIGNRTCKEEIVWWKSGEN